MSDPTKTANARTELVIDALAVAGAGLITAGVWQLNHPAAFIIAGAFLLAGSYLAARNG